MAPTSSFPRQLTRQQSLCWKHDKLLDFHENHTDSNWILDPGRPKWPLKEGGVLDFGSPFSVEIEITGTSEGLQLLDAQYRDCIQRETWCMGPYAGADFNLTLCPLHSMSPLSSPSSPTHVPWATPQQPYARVDLIPQSGTKNLASAYLSQNS